MKKLITLVLGMVLSIGLYSFAFAADTSALENAMTNAVKECKSELDVTSYNIAPQSALDIYFDLCNTNPEFAYADNNVRCQYMGSFATKLFFTYKASPAEIKAQKAAVENEISKIIAVASKGSSNADKVKAVHDYIVKNSSYDFSTSSTTPYELLVGRKGICKAYTMTFKMIMNKMNIPCEIASSDTMCHEWDVVKVGNNWYNVDLTFDTNSFVQLNDLTYANSLKSDNYYKAIGYSDWVVSDTVVCTDNTFDAMM